MQEYDIIIVGAGVTGLWIANRLKREGFNLLVVDDGGENPYFSQGLMTGAGAQAKMPERWQACFEGWGDIDLTAVAVESGQQVLWPIGENVSGLAVVAAAKALSTEAKKLKPADFPEALWPLRKDKKRNSHVFALPEKEVDVASLMDALAGPLKGRILRGAVQELLPDGQIAVSGIGIRAQLVVFAAGVRNERAFTLMRIKEKRAHRRLLRHVFVQPLPFAFQGHAVTEDLAPRVTVTSHLLEDGRYLWHLGGELAEKTAKMKKEPALKYAKKEMQALFPHIDWNAKKWAARDAAEAVPHNKTCPLPPGAHVHQRGRVLITWATHLTFAPAVCDRVIEWLRGKDVIPKVRTRPPPWPATVPAGPPWKGTSWKKLP